MNLRTLRTSSLCLFASFFSGLAVADNATLTDFARCLTITSGFALGDEVLEDFPVLVRLSEESITGFSYADFHQLNGADLRFMLPDGTVLSHEIQTWNPGGTSLVWVKIPELTASTTFQCLFGTDLAVPNTPADTWSAYAGVWHFEEGGTGGTSYDSTANHYDGDNAAGITDADGVLGRARENAARGILLSSTANVSFGPTITLSGWFYHNAGTVSYDHVFYRKNLGKDASGFAAEINNTNLGSMTVLGSSSGAINISTGLTREEWYHITLAFDASTPSAVTAKLFNNGVLKSTANLGSNGAFDSACAISIGCDSDRNDGSIWRGRFDEVRMRTAEVSPVWIAAEYTTMADASSLVYGDIMIENPIYLSDDTGITWNATQGFVAYGQIDVGEGTLLVSFPERNESYTIAANAVAEVPYSLALTSLDPNTCYTYVILATNADNRVQSAPRTFFTGEIALAKESDGVLNTQCDAIFTFSRPDSTDACSTDLTISYALTGSAVAGIDYAVPSSVITIPAGESTATLRIPVLPSVTSGNTLTLNLLPGAYKTGADATATASLYKNSGDRSGAKITDFARLVTIHPNLDLGGETLSNFPVLVRLGSHIAGFSYDQFTFADGSDLCFFDAEGTALSYEIEQWNPAGESLVWVLAPTFGEDTVISLCYGRDTPVLNFPRDVWFEYAGVWHLDAVDADGISLDASPNQRNVDVGGAFVENDGAVGLSQGVVGSNGGTKGDQGILVLGSEDLVMGTSFSVSAWVLHNDCNSSWGHLFYRKDSMNADGGWATEINNNNLGQISVGSGGSSKVNIATGLDKETWHYVTLAYHGNYVYFYNNGTLMGNNNFSKTVVDNGRPVVFGSNSLRKDSPWLGRYDECRIRLNAEDAGLRTLADTLIMSDPEALVYSESIGSNGPKLGGAPTITHVGNGTYTLSSELLGGVGELLAVCDDAITNSLSGGIVSGAHTFSDIPLLGLAPNTIYTVGLVATNQYGDVLSFSNPEAFYTGALAVSLDVPINAYHKVNGFFRISRPDTPAACRYALPVHYALSGSAVAGTDFDSPLEGTLVIPADSDSVILPIRVLAGATPGATLTLALTPGLYVTDASSTATMTFGDTDFLGQFSTRMPFTVQNLPEDEDATPLADFPVLVRLGPDTTPAFSTRVLRSATAEDLVFATDDGLILPHEIQTWDPDGESLIWVRVPAVQNGTTFYAYYGADLDAIAPLLAASLPSDTWLDYIGVWHLDDSGDAFAPVADSTVNDLDGVSGPFAAAVNEGVIGACRRISNASGSGAEMGNITVPYKPAMDIDGSYAASWWVKADVFSWNYFITRKTFDETAAWGVQVNYEVKGFRYYVDAGQSTINLPSALETGTWYKIGFSYDAATRKVHFYLNGEEFGSTSNKNPPSNGSENLYIGGLGMGHGTLNGLMDEVRLRRAPTDAAWVRAEYLQETTGQLLAAGASEPVHPATVIFFR